MDCALESFLTIRYTGYDEAIHKGAAGNRGAFFVPAQRVRRVGYGGLFYLEESKTQAQGKDERERE